MTTIDFISSNEVFRGFPKKHGQLYKISIENEPRLNLSFGSPQRGGQGLGKKHRVRDFYIDRDNRVHAGFIDIDGSGQFYRYAAIGKLQILQEDEEAAI